MRQILCEACGREKELVTGERLTMAGEYERVVWGTALVPQSDQRVMYVNGVPTPLAPNEYTCDFCSRAIHPGDRCCAWSAWPEGFGMKTWEHEFIQPSAAGENIPS
jgi:hypothetical protein